LLKGKRKEVYGNRNTVKKKLYTGERGKAKWGGKGARKGIIGVWKGLRLRRHVALVFIAGRVVGEGRYQSESRRWKENPAHRGVSRKKERRYCRRLQPSSCTMDELGAL